MDEAAALYRQGWTLRKIAAEHRCSFQRLSTLLRQRADVKMRTPSHPRALRLSPDKQAAIRAAIEQKMNQAEIARLVEVTPSTVARLAEREGLELFKGKRLSWNVDRARQMRADNISYERIADELGVAPMTVWRQLNPATSRTRVFTAGGGHVQGRSEVTAGPWSGQPLLVGRR
ncbi:hypothetical protein [Nonomuraea basaltis]|uniref:hypothetical protein n=1 Tax=Nonomuraea basaltis TaxID=2495887 RepID=UPI00110C5DED|nr:hypothetical protein [Nonomuraea basaltis]TMR97305.1 hypothetical protein EJK15_18705 [Nonomuraea basaltis]